MGRTIWLQHIDTMMIDSTRYPRLSRIQTPDDLRTFEEADLTAVADELRAYPVSYTHPTLPTICSV